MHDTNIPQSSVQKSESYWFSVWTFWQVLFVLKADIFCQFLGLAAGSISEAINEVRKKRPMSRTDVSNSRAWSFQYLCPIQFTQDS